MSTALAQLMMPIGAVAEAFLWDRRLISGIMGPVGSGKTTTCIRKMVMSCFWQKPGPDGVRRAKWGVVRDTYPQLKKTALASWWTWFPKQMGDWNGEAPYEHVIRGLIPGAGRFELIVIFAAMGEHKAEDVMRGWEVTGIWLNEADLVAQEVFAYAMTRIGRYPSMAQGGCQWRGVLIDMNAPDVENWTYELLVDGDLGVDAEIEEQLREELGEQYGVGFHRQPGGRSLDPPPENIVNLPRGYYAQQIMALAKKPWLVRRMVDNLFGPVRHGQPVYPEYVDAIHCDDGLEPIADVPIRLATDAELTAAAVFLQRDHRGQIRVLGEVVNFAADDETELEQIGAVAFGKKCARYFLDHFAGHELAETVWCDPAATAGEKASGADPSWRQKFQEGLREALANDKIRVRAAPVPGNKLETRLDAVRKPMMTLVEGGGAGFVISGKCRTLRRGFKGMFVYRRTQLQGGHGRFENKPVKNDYSHVQDACQYGCVGLARAGNGEGRLGAHPRDLQLARRLPKRVSAYNVHGGGR